MSVAIVLAALVAFFGEDGVFEGPRFSRLTGQSTLV